jgi:hypothetical protein
MPWGLARNSGRGWSGFAGCPDNAITGIQMPGASLLSELRCRQRIHWGLLAPGWCARYASGSFETNSLLWSSRPEAACGPADSNGPA